MYQKVLHLSQCSNKYNPSTLLKPRVLAKITYWFIIIFCVLILGVKVAYSQEFTSGTYRTLHPVMNAGGYGTSENFKLFGSITEISVGTSSSATFKDNAGFLYFPFASTPVVSATAGSGQAALSWTASQGFAGWTASGYNVGQATVSGGPYTYSASLGNVLSSTRTGLTNGTTYYFVIRVEDAFGNSIATSSQISAVPVASASPTPTPAPAPPSGGGSGGASGGAGGAGGGYVSPAVTAANFSGRAYPKSTVTLLKDAQVAATTIADADANFSIKLAGLSAGNYIFSVYTEDKDGRRSALLTFPVSLTTGLTTTIGGIFIAPTIALDKSEVKRGDTINMFGQSAPKADIVINVSSDEEFFAKTISDANGVYLHHFDTSVLEEGSHYTKSKASIGNLEVSGFSAAINFKVGKKTVLTAAPAKCSRIADLDMNCRVNLVDFSIEAYWYKRPSAPANVDLNKDGKITLVDFSIMAFYWTG